MSALRRAALVFAACSPLVASAGGAAQASDAKPQALVEYAIDHREPGRWTVRVHVTGLDASRRDVALELVDWGEWTALDSEYLKAVRCTPELESDSSTPGSTGDGARSYRLRLPEDWNGELEAEYTLVRVAAGSKQQEEHPLLPFDTGSYTQAFSINTLMRVLVDGEPLEARRVVDIQAREGQTVATGWAGVSSARQTAELPAGADNALIVIGSLVGHAQALDGDAPCEVIQFARGPDATESVLSVVKTLLDAYTRCTGRELDYAVRVFLDDRCGGNIGGTRTDRGYVVQFDPAEAEGERQPELRRLLAHELFHNWLGGLIHSDDPSMVWFTEGFTDYFALWHLAAAGLVSREWFASALLGKDAAMRADDAYGRVAFADPEVDWRDGGAVEALAYRGGPVLAFHADVALRRAGRSGLHALIVDLLARDGGRISQQSILAAFSALGLRDFHRQHIAGRELPPLGPALVSIGFAARRDAKSLAYLGIETSGGLAPGKVLAIDPDGPAAGSGLKLGDEIVGYYPSRSHPPEIEDVVTTKYRFGLNLVAVGFDGTYVDVLRDGEPLQVPLTPRPIAGGFRTEYEATGEGLAAFFAYPPGSSR